MLFFQDQEKILQLSKEKFSHHRMSFLVQQTAYFKKTALIVDHVHNKLVFANYNKHLAGAFPDSTTKTTNEKNILNVILETDLDLFKEIASTINNFHDRFNIPCDYFTFAINVKGSWQPMTILVTAYTTSEHIAGSTEKPLISYYNIDIAQNNKPGSLTTHTLQDKIKYYCLISKFIINTHAILLSPAEILIFKYFSFGYSEIEVSNILNISIGNLKAVKSKLMNFLNARSTAQVIATLTKQGFI